MLTSLVHGVHCFIPQRQGVLNTVPEYRAGLTGRGQTGHIRSRDTGDIAGHGGEGRHLLQAGQLSARHRRQRCESYLLLLSLLGLRGDGGQGGEADLLGQGGGGGRQGGQADLLVGRGRGGVGGGQGRQTDLVGRDGGGGQGAEADLVGGDREGEAGRQVGGEDSQPGVPLQGGVGVVVRVRQSRAHAQGQQLHGMGVGNGGAHNAVHYNVALKEQYVNI